MSSAAQVFEHPVVAGARVAAEGLEKACRAEAWQLGDDDVEAALAALLDVEARTAALRGALLREAQTRDLKARTRASNLERWLGDRFRLSLADAAARIRAATLHGRHPHVENALADATLTTEQASVIGTALDKIATLPELTDDDRDAAAGFLVEHAASLTPRDLERAGQAVLETLTRAPSQDDPAEEAALAREQDRAEAEAQAAERNNLQVGRRRGRLRAILDLGTIGEAILNAWLRRAGKPVPGTDGFEDTRSLSERRGDALVDLLAAAAAGTLPPPGTHGEDDEDLEDVWSLSDPLGDDPHDPSHHHGNDPSGGGSASPEPAPPTALLTVTTTLEGLRTAIAGAGALDARDTGLGLSAAALRQIACDAVIIPAVLGGDSQVLDLGRATRHWNRAQRRAAALRDRGCVAPGCDRPPAACQLHHSWHWIEGGPTDLDNGALLCPFHHRMVHRQGWNVALAPNGYPHLVPPAAIDPDRRPRQHHRFRLTALTEKRRT